MLIYRVHLALGSSNTHRRCHNTLLHCLLLDAGSGGRVRSMSPFLWPYLIGAGEALLLPVWGRTRASVSLGGDACGGPQPWAIPFQRPREEGNARSPLTPNLQLLSGRILGRGALVPVSPSRRAPATTRRRPRMNESNAGRNPRQRKSELDVRE